MRINNVPALLVSIVVHAGVLLAMFFYKLPGQMLEELLAIEATAPEDRDIDEVVETLDTELKPAETYNTVSGSVSTTVGGSNAPLKEQHKIEETKLVQDMKVKINVGAENLPGLQELGNDLGEAAVNGEVGALVEGYGPALDRLTQELIRMMRKDKLLVVWLFDESESMKDDQKDIKGRMSKVYTELKIVDKEPDKTGVKFRAGKKRLKVNEIMLTAITSFGKNFHVHTKAPTGEIAEIMTAIDKIPVDKSGAENMCSCMMEAIAKYRTIKARSKRKLVFIVISDESGDDGANVEPVVKAVRKMKSPIYVLGRESVFGSFYAYVNWRQPETGRNFRLPIRRGPETPYAEQLLWDGYRRRFDATMSGFGPYEQVRLAKDTGGIFFQLPHEQANLNDFDARKYEKLAMREYLPNLDPRITYSNERDRSTFRKALWDTILLFNPHDKSNKGLELPDPDYGGERFPADPREFGPRVKARGNQVLGLLARLNLSISRLQAIRSLRAQEASLRWRANYDLMLAQLYWYRFRMAQYGLGMDNFVKNELQQRLIKNPKHNRWRVFENGNKIIQPSAEQQRFFKITQETLKSDFESSRKMLARVAETHPGTPWARRAQWELRRPVGVTFGTYYQPPPVRRPPGKPQPKPTPPPRL